MFRRSHIIAKSLSGGFQLNNFMFGLWNKPETRDSRVKEYVPEVVEESLTEQKAVLEENNERDIIVEAGQKVLRLMENKAPTPSIIPNLAQVLREFGAHDLICQRSLSYLLYSGSLGGKANALVSADLVQSFASNFQQLIEHIEANGSTIHIQKLAEEEKDASTTKGEQPSEQTSDAEGEEAPDVTAMVRVVAGMTMACVQCESYPRALRCVSFALEHAKDSDRRGALFAMKAGILNHLRRYDEAVESAKSAIAASDTVQGYLQGAAALGQLKRRDERLMLLAAGARRHEHNPQIEASLQQERQWHQDQLKKQGKSADHIEAHLNQLCLLEESSSRQEA